MITLKTKLAAVAASALALALTAQAQMTPAMPTESLTTSGFGLASWQSSKGAADDHLNIDDAMLKVDGKAGNFEGVLSLYYVPNSGGDTGSGDIHLLDANVTYSVNDSWSITAGRYLSWMGYESFFPIKNPEITGAYLAPVIAGYEDGVQVVYKDPAKNSAWNAGASIEDSALNSGVNTGYAGDGETKHAFGAEAYIDITSIENNDLWFGVSYDSKYRVAPIARAQETYDLHDQYQINKQVYVAAELAYHDGGVGDALPFDSTSWLVLVDYTFTDGGPLSAAFRIGGDQFHHSAGVPDDTKYTFAPTYAFNKYFSVRAEVSYAVHASIVDGSEIPTQGKNLTTYGLQAVFQF